MEGIAQFSERAAPLVVDATLEQFHPLLVARRPQIAQTLKKTFQFGPSERHHVDIYYPSYGTTNAPILFFLYGGGFVTGARSLVPGLIYDNVGAFFAQRGILTAIPDYRLAPETTYPGPARDVRDAVKFVLSSPDVDVAGSGADKSRVYVLGHSAGGTHGATLFLNEDILDDQERNLIQGAIFLSAASGTNPHMSIYYGEAAEDQARNCPFGLLTSKPAEKVKQLLPSRLCFLKCENDDPVFTGWGETFQQTLREKGVDDFHEHIMLGHNHVSPAFALFSGEGEEWGEEVVRWIKA